MSRKWTPAQHKKFRASMRRRKRYQQGAVEIVKTTKKDRDRPDPRVRDAVIFLKQFEAEIKRAYDLKRRLRRSDLYAMLALDSLVGGP